MAQVKAERSGGGPEGLDGAALADIGRLGPAGEATLIKLLQVDVPPMLVSALGEAEGDAGGGARC